MVDRFRRFLLVLVLGILAVAGFSLYGKVPTPIGQVDIKVMDKNVDVEIQNFKVVHEQSGKKEWELTADTAQINYDTDVIWLSNVELKLSKGLNKDMVVVADSGTIQDDNQKIHLRGNVKMVGTTGLFSDRLGKRKDNPQQ